MVADLQLPEATEPGGTHGVELDFSLGCQGRLDAGVHTNPDANVLSRCVLPCARRAEVC